MGRYHALKPHHLYPIPPDHSPTLFKLLKTTYTSPSALIQSSSISAFAVGNRIPGYKVSAAFISNLHSNLFVEIDSSFDSPASTPSCLQPTIANLPPSPVIRSMSDPDVAPPDALRLPETKQEVAEEKQSQETTIGEDGVPILKTLPANTDDLKAEALHIVADTVAQQRNIGSRALIFHPITLALLVVAVAMVKQFYTGKYETNWIMTATTSTGVIMSILGGIRLWLGPYIFEAERVGTWNWLNQGRSRQAEEETGLHVLGDSDEILLTKFGDDYIGTIIFRGVQPVLSPASPGANKRTRRAQSPSKHTRMVIRAWSVAQKYRRKEVGTALLEDAITIGQENGWTVNGVEFAQDHANSKRVLPAFLNGALEKYDKVARATLDKVQSRLQAGQEKGRKRK